MNETVHVIGAGLAGCEAAYQLIKRGIPVRLYEMKPAVYSPAHRYAGFAELVCSNSLRADRLSNAAGLLKDEMRTLGSIIMQAADEAKVPAGGALAVNRVQFSDKITQCLKTSPLVNVIEGEVTDLAGFDGIVIVATGPLTGQALSETIGALIGEDYLHFFDAAAPIITRESIDFSKVFAGSRYGKGGEDYLNCPMSREEYESFYTELVGAECAQSEDFEDSSVFEGCMPVEVMARRGFQTLLFGPLKPVGLTDPHSDIKPFAVVQLRKENIEETLYNLVGFQTHLKFGEQKRVFSLIPGLANAEIVRFGVMHRNTYMNSPRLLDRYYRLQKNKNFFFAGQMTGVEGYIESAASGMLAGIAAAQTVLGRKLPLFSDRTAIGALAEYVSSSASDDFQPMNINFGIMEPSDKKIRKKEEKNEYISNRALDEVRNILETLESEMRYR